MMTAIAPVGDEITARAAAKTRPHSVPFARWNERMAIGRVYSSRSDSVTIAQVNSSQAARKLKIVTVAIPGRASGIAMDR